MTPIEKSEQQAEIIKQIALFISFFDVEHCRKASLDMKQQALRQESMAVLLPDHTQLKNELLREQGIALGLLCDYKESLDKIQDFRAKIKGEESAIDFIRKNLFV